MSALEVIDIGPSQYADWTSLVKASPGGSIYSDPGYLAALCEATSATFRIIGLARAGRLEAGIALYERGAVGGRYVAPRLLLYYCGPVLLPHASKYPSEQTAREVEALGLLARRIGTLGYGSVVLKGLPAVAEVRAFVSAGWRVSPAYTYVVPLDDLAGQWTRVEQNLRRLIKRCTERDGITFDADNDFEAFWRLHEATLSRKGAALYLPKDRFARFFATLRAADMATIYHARLPDGRPIATQLVLHGAYQGTHSVCAGGDPEHARLGAQAFLRWRVFEDLAAKGYTSNDLTDAALGPVTHFKAQFGGRLALSHVLEARMSSRYAAVGLAASIAGKAKGLAGRVVRGVAGASRPANSRQPGDKR